jgi:hypothetical protein
MTGDTVQYLIDMQARSVVMKRVGPVACGFHELVQPVAALLHDAGPVRSLRHGLNSGRAGAGSPPHVRMRSVPARDSKSRAQLDRLRTAVQLLKRMRETLGLVYDLCH